ncbi:DNA polymerase alpha/epsilon subunit B domain-containing protein [Ditylenchus destructor]|nr:DNA polymerase alpha/epsilon subunit B domain-containing protein [Ditylenchus destructor]
MEDEDLGEHFGGMSSQWFEERIVDFGYDLSEDAEECLERLNALATLHKMKNDDIVDGIIALMSNQKKSSLSVDLVHDFTNQIQSKPKPKPNITPKPSINPRTILQRSVLKEIPIGELDLDETYDVSMLDDGDGGGYGGQTDAQKFSVKFSYTGSEMTTNRVHPKEADAYPSLNLLKDCSEASFSYGNDKLAHDLSEIIAIGEIIEDDENQIGIPTKLTGNVFASDNEPLSFENAILYTNSNAVPLNFEKVNRVALYPGMRQDLVGIYSEKEFEVQTIAEPPQLELSKLNRSLITLPSLKVMIASGPFVSNDITAEASFKTMIDHAVRSSANALILMGPFCKDFEPKGGDGPDADFRRYMRIIHDLIVFSKAKIRVLIVSSARDIYALPLFPTPPYCVPDQIVSEHITYLPDPMVFELEGVQFAATTSEVIMHLSKLETYRCEDMENEDRMQRLISHVFSSHSLYPIYPTDLPFVLKDSRKKLSLDTKPHVLLVPSMLQSSVKVLDGSIVINPGRFVRGKSGVCALLEIDLNSASAVLDDSICQYSIVDIFNVNH